MADIRTHVDAIELASRGEDVRDAIIGALEAMNAPATAESAGLVSVDGTTVTVDGDGRISAPGWRELPPATTEALGGVIPDGATVTVDADGTIHAAAGYTHPAYAARTGKPASSVAPAFGSSFKVSQVTSDSTGHVTGMTDRTVTFPNATATQSRAGLMSAADKAKLDGIASGTGAIGGVKVNGRELAPDSEGWADVTVAEGSADGTISVDGSDVAVHGLGSAAYLDASEVPSRTSELVNDSGFLTGVPTATESVQGTSRPDNVTVFVSGGVLSALDPRDALSALRARVEALARRVDALDGGGGQTASFSGGTLTISGGGSVGQGGLLSIEGSLGPDGTLTL